MRYLLLMLTLVASAHSFAGFKTANDVLERCTTDEDDQSHNSDTMHCLGYLLGVFDTLEGISEEFQATGMPPTGFCMPDSEVTGGQVWRIAVKHLEENPELLHYNAAGVLIQGYIEAFPCR